jgi:DNA-binding response OmpR family regulator
MTRPPRILLVEDNKDVLTLVSYHLSSAGFAVIPAKDGREGLDKALQEQPDLILADLMLPALNGYELCAFLKQHVRHKAIPIIIWSATKIQPKDEQLAKECGVDRFLLKSVDPDTLVEQIRSLLSVSSRSGERTPLSGGAADA